jgi:hypothetical protein
MTPSPKIVHYSTLKFSLSDLISNGHQLQMAKMGFFIISVICQHQGRNSKCVSSSDGPILY